MKAYFIESQSFDPYHNLALEEYLLNHLADDEMIFYLWQNQHTVVIGYNQSAYKECRLHLMESEGISLARRSSGGGAVYHDLGNLNFTFIANERDFDTKKQGEVILLALKSYGINAEMSGRNDLEVNGYKISGNAFMNRGRKKLQHGTLLVDVNKEMLTRYLDVSPLKLKAKGVDSVVSRIINLKELNKEIKIDQLKIQLKDTFEKVYQLKFHELCFHDDYTELIKKYACDSFRVEKLPLHHFEVLVKYPWAELMCYVSMKHFTIERMKIYTDAMNLELVEKLECLFHDLPMNQSVYEERLETMNITEHFLKEDFLDLFIKIKEAYNGC